jgi:predicted transcriptional regulator
MAKIKNIFLILTKRPFAIDEIRSKFNATTSDYSITIKLNQLDRSMNIWGLKYTTT